MFGSPTTFRKIRTYLLLYAGLFAFTSYGFAADSDSVSTSNNTPRFVLSLDTRSTIIDRRHVRINGVLSGVSFGKRSHKITVGYYWLGYNASKRLIDWHKSLAHSINLSYYTKTDVAFVSFAYWYPLLKTKRWTVSIPVELGAGRETSNYRELSDDSAINNKHFSFAPYQAGVYGEYRVTPWAGLSAQVGYRNALSESHFRRHFSGVYYSYGICLYPGTIYTDVKGWMGNRK
jgi:hypothetical protein